MVRTVASLVAAVSIMAATSVRADEGMWTFDNVPLKTINTTYGLKIDQKWLDHVQGATIRLNVGCSASVVSPEGLVFTNHHCVQECAQYLSSPDQDYVADGFMAATREDEQACPGMTAEILLRMVDYTKAIQSATRGLDGDAFVKTQNSRSAEFEKSACGNDANLRCQMVTLYQGGQYKLYVYRKYSDLRLVFAPEFQAAFFGGDPDNFNFPRYALDIGFLRLYENGQPAATPQHLKWRTTAPEVGAPVFAAGNPGMTQRQMTVAQLESQRDIALPLMQILRSELRGRLINFSEQNDENKRISTDTIYGIENSFKAAYGQELTLRNPAVMAMKRKQEAYLKSTLNGAFKTEIGDPWADTAKAQQAFADLYVPYSFLEGGLNTSELFAIARKLVRAAEERRKPSAERLPEFAESRLPAMRNYVLSPGAIEKPLEEIYLSFRLSKAREYLTADAPETHLLLGEDSPEALAKALVERTELDNPQVRRGLWDGGLDAIRASNDPMIRYALRIDDAARAIRRRYDTEVTAPTRIAAEKIARVRLKAYGTSTYPDATFSPRLSYGKVAGWTWRGVNVPAFTTLNGLYDRATGKQPFELADHFAAAKGTFDGSTVFNYVTTNDIAGGSSGSAVINAAGEIVGAAFDGNIHSLGGTYVYDPALNRTVVVSTAAVTVALDKIYDDQALLDELLGR